MSTTQQDDPLATAPDPQKPWQIVGIFLIVLVGLILAVLLLRGGDWFRSKPAQLARSDGGSSLPYVGPPDQREAAVHQAAFRPASAAPPPPPKGPDESAAFDAPLRDQVVMPAFPHEERQAPPEDGQGGNGTMARAVAFRVKHPTYTINTGTVIPCNQVTKIDTNSGAGNVQVTANIPVNIPSMDGHMTLIDKGSTVYGTIGHGLVNGLDRVAVVWNQITTPPPDNVEIDISSPAAGPLGEAGLDGDVNRHEWQKIKGVVLLSLIQGSLNIAQSALASKGTSYINFGSVSNGANEAGNILLQSQIQIPDTITRDQGLACSIFVAQKLDFSSVYTARIVK